MELIPQFEHLIDKYDFFIFDVYGVLHNGYKALPESIQFLEKLKERGKSVSILSNAPFRRRCVMKRLRDYGLDPSFYQHILTAGEIVHTSLKERKTPWYARLGTSCYFVGLPNMTEIMAETPFHKVSHLEMADFILLAGPDEWGQHIDDYQEILTQALKLKLPLLCANPDCAVFKGDQKHLRAGKIADLYKKMGGEVYYEGKPEPRFYQALLKDMGNPPAEKVVCIGDSLATDIKGASLHNMDSALVMSPLAYHELGLDITLNIKERQVREKVMSLLEKKDYTPTYVIQISR